MAMSGVMKHLRTGTTTTTGSINMTSKMKVKYPCWALHVLLAHMTHTDTNRYCSQKAREDIISGFENNQT